MSEQEHEPLGHELHVTDPLPFSWNSGWDTIIAVVLVLCSLTGILTNLVANRYFIKEYGSGTGRSNRRFFNLVYVLITLNDLLVCSTVFPVAASFFGNRERVLFGNPTFCSLWALLWEILPFFTVFLVGFLSFTRLLTLLVPRIRFPHYLVPVTAVLCVTILALCKGGAIVLHFLEPDHEEHEEGHDIFYYNTHSVYCFLFARVLDDTRVWTIYSISGTVFMAGPIPFILTSCLVSLFKIHQSAKLAKTVSSSSKMQRTASTTIVLVTVTYLVYNVPVFINYICFTVASFSPQLDYREVYGVNSFLYYYSWPLTYIVCVTLNAVTNPFIYCTRMVGFKRYLCRLLGISVLVRGDTNCSTRSHLNAESVKMSPSPILVRNLSRIGEDTVVANKNVVNDVDTLDACRGVGS